MFNPNFGNGYGNGYNCYNGYGNGYNGYGNGYNGYPPGPHQRPPPPPPPPPKRVKVARLSDEDFQQRIARWRDLHKQSLALKASAQADPNDTNLQHLSRTHAFSVKNMENRIAEEVHERLAGDSTCLIPVEALNMYDRCGEIKKSQKLLTPTHFEQLRNAWSPGGVMHQYFATTPSGASSSSSSLASSTSSVTPSAVASSATLTPASSSETDPNIPDLKISAPKLSVPKPPGPDIPALKVSAPKLSAPKLSVPKLSAPKLSVPKPPGPDIPALKVSAPKPPGPDIPALKVSAPKPPGPDIPALKVSAPKLSAPKLSVPKLSVPKLSVPKPPGPDIPALKVSAPKLSVPKPPGPDIPALKVSAPKLSAPKLSVPKLSVPKPPGPDIPALKVSAPKLSVPKTPGPNILDLKPAAAKLPDTTHTLHTDKEPEYIVISDDEDEDASKETTVSEDLSMAILEQVADGDAQDERDFANDAICYDLGIISAEEYHAKAKFKPGKTARSDNHVSDSPKTIPSTLPPPRAAQQKDGDPALASGLRDRPKGGHPGPDAAAAAGLESYCEHGHASTAECIWAALQAYSKPNKSDMVKYAQSLMVGTCCTFLPLQLYWLPLLAALQIALLYKDNRRRHLLYFGCEHCRRSIPRYWVPLLDSLERVKYYVDGVDNVRSKNDQRSISHLCGNKWCVSSEHLVLESQELNQTREECFRRGLALIKAGKANEVECNCPSDVKCLHFQHNQSFIAVFVREWLMVVCNIDVFAQDGAHNSLQKLSHVVCGGWLDENAFQYIRQRIPSTVTSQATLRPVCNTSELNLVWYRWKTSTEPSKYSLPVVAAANNGRFRTLDVDDVRKLVHPVDNVRCGNFSEVARILSLRCSAPLPLDIAPWRMFLFSTSNRLTCLRSGAQGLLRESFRYDLCKSAWYTSLRQANRKPTNPSKKPFTKIRSILTHVHSLHSEIPEWLRAFFMYKEINLLEGVSDNFSDFLVDEGIQESVRGNIMYELERGNWHPSLAKLIPEK